MALALGKPVVLLIEEGIQEDFWRQVLPHIVHHIFSKTNFDKQLENLIENVNQKYEEAVTRVIV